MSLRTVGLAVLLAGAASVQAQMHKCVDERGVTYYSDRPRPGCKGGPVNIQPIPSLSGKVAPRADDLSRQDADFKRRQIERERADAADKAALQERCARLRQEQAWLASGVRLGQITDQGERVYMDDASRDARLAAVREQMRGCP